MSLSLLAPFVSSRKSLETNAFRIRRRKRSESGLRHDVNINISSSSRGRVMAAKPRASAMSAPEFLPGGKNCYLTSLPPLRSWARSLAKANTHNEARQKGDDPVDATYFHRPVVAVTLRDVDRVRRGVPTPFFDLFLDEDQEQEHEQEQEQTSNSLGGFVETFSSIPGASCGGGNDHAGSYLRAFQTTTTTQIHPIATSIEPMDHEAYLLFHEIPVLEGTPPQVLQTMVAELKACSCLLLTPNESALARDAASQSSSANAVHAVRVLDFKDARRAMALSKANFETASETATGILDDPRDLDSFQSLHANDASKHANSSSKFVTFVKTFFANKLRFVKTSLRGGFPGNEPREHAMAFVASAVLRRERERGTGIGATVGGTLLDLSCGGGLFAKAFADEGEYETIIAVDERRAACDATAGKLSALDYTQSSSLSGNAVDNAGTSVAVVHAHYHNLPFQDSVFDAAHAAGAVHRWGDVQKVLAEVTRTLKPGATLVATTTCLDEASRARMRKGGIDSSSYHDTRKESLSPLPFWDANSVQREFQKAKDLERCEVQVVETTFVLVTCAKKSAWRSASTQSTHSLESAETKKETERKNNAVRVPHDSRGVPGGLVAHAKTKTVNGVYDTTAVSVSV